MKTKQFRYLMANMFLLGMLISPSGGGAGMSLILAVIWFIAAGMTE